MPLIKYELNDGSVTIEALEAQGNEADYQHGVTRVSRQTDSIVKSKIKFEEAMANVKPFASALLNTMKDLANSPDVIAIEFGVKMSAEAGAFIASASSEASIKVSLSWKKS